MNAPKLNAIVESLRDMLLDRSQAGDITPGIMEVQENLPFDLNVGMPCVNIFVRAENIENDPQNFCAEIDLQVFHVDGMTDARSEHLREICHSIRKAINRETRIGPSNKFIVTGITYSQPGSRLADGALILQADVRLKIYYKEDWHG